MNFGQALEALKNLKCVARAGWNGKGMYIYLWTPGETQLGVPRPEPSTLPYIVMKTADNNMVPWLASQTDILATDWDIVSH